MWTGPLARRHKAERRHSFRLNHKGVHAAAKGEGGGAGVNTVDKDDSYDNKGDDVVSVGRQKTGHDPNDPADQAGDGCLETRSTKVPTRMGAAPPSGPSMMTS